MARKRNIESKPVVSAGSVSTSSAKQATRTSTRSAAHHKSSSVDVAPAPEVDSIANLSQAVAPETDPQEVAKLAYYLWEQRGGQGGTSEADWLRAERELLNRS